MGCGDSRPGKGCGESRPGKGENKTLKGGKEGEGHDGVYQGTRVPPLSLVALLHFHQVLSIHDHLKG
jgi:hypothetical protein